MGWFSATSPVDDLTGFFLFLDGTLTLFDGDDLPLSGVKIIFSKIKIDAGHQTEINLINPGDDPADVELQLNGPIAAGGAPGWTNLSIPVYRM